MILPKYITKVVTNAVIYEVLPSYLSCAGCDQVLLPIAGLPGPDRKP